MMQEQRVLIIDDEPDIRELLEITLLRMGLDTISAATVQEAILRLKDGQPNLCLTDMKLPDGNGIDIVRYVQEHMPHVPIAVITAFGSMETAIEALKAGAYDFVSKPVDLKKLRNLIQTALKLSGDDKSQVSNKNEHNKPQGSPILGQSPAIKQLKSTIAKLARSQAPVYIHGESGSGKELVAKQIHMQSPRAANPFIPVNCGAIPAELMESEFFGHKKGSFTGATADKQGLFQAASGGTLFLDEVADLPLSMQVKLLRAIQERAVKPVGGLEEIAVDVRILSATHKNLELEVEQNRFRQDLYYRLNVIRLDVPSLRNRISDVPLLTGHFLKAITKRWELEEIKLSKDALLALSRYTFPGNVRELINILERASTLCEDNTIQVSDLQLQQNAIHPSSTATTTTMMDRIAAPPSPLSQPETPSAQPIPAVTTTPRIQPDERDIILAALERTRWNRTAAAKLLGISFRQLRYRIKKFELDTV